MKRFLLILLCLLMLLSATACGGDDVGGNTTTTTAEPVDVVGYYAHDPVIDRFFVDYLAKYSGSLDPTTIRRGTDTGEYLAVIGQCNVTVRNASTQVEGEDTTMYILRVIIEGGTTVEARDRMMSVFSRVSQVLDNSCSADTINSTIAYLEEQTETVQQYRYCNGVKVEQYVPLVESVGVACRIELMAHNYIPLEYGKQ